MRGVDTEGYTIAFLGADGAASVLQPEAWFLALVLVDLAIAAPISSLASSSLVASGDLQLGYFGVAHGGGRCGGAIDVALREVLHEIVRPETVVHESIRDLCGTISALGGPFASLVGALLFRPALLALFFLLAAL